MTVVAPRSVRSPLSVRAAALLLVPLAVVSGLGAVLFTFVWGEASGLGLVFGAFSLATTATAVAAVPSLLRGLRSGWAVVVVWACSFSYWSVYKVFAEGEGAAAPFLLASLAVLALLCTGSARAHAGVDAVTEGHR